MKLAILTLAATVVLIGCQPQSDSGTGTDSLNSSAPAETPPAPATNAPAPATPPPQP